MTQKLATMLLPSAAFHIIPADAHVALHEALEDEFIVPIPFFVSGVKYYFMYHTQKYSHESQPQTLDLMRQYILQQPQERETLLALVVPALRAAYMRKLLRCFALEADELSLALLGI